MKQTLAVMTLTLAAVSGVFAQGAGRPGNRGGTPPTVEQMVERRVQMLTNRLGLDSAQQQQAKTIVADEFNAAQALRDQSEAAQNALRDAVKASAPDAQIDQLAAQVGVLHGQGAAIHAKGQSKLRALLNSAQKEKLDSGGDRPGPGGRGGFGRGPAF